MEILSHAYVAFDKKYVNKAVLKEIGDTLKNDIR